MTNIKKLKIKKNALFAVACIAGFAAIICFLALGGESSLPQGEEMLVKLAFFAAAAVLGFIAVICVGVCNTYVDKIKTAEANAEKARIAAAHKRMGMKN